MLDQVRLGDLFLACACAGQVDGAAATLEREHMARLLRIATHGFFLQPSSPIARQAERAPYRFWDRALAVSSGLPPEPEEPMLRSGLITAGNRPVTALELSGLNLWGTELVVLSACDTGLGQTQIGQGVFGLRRAFLVAGAETVVTSLWKVEDAVAPALMEQDYRGLVAGQGRSEAMHHAMRKIRETHPHPYDWAPFIVVGRDGPLQLR